MNGLLKDQTDIGLDDTPLNCSDGAPAPHGQINKDMARQEFAQEADINYMLSRLGVTQPRGTPAYGEWDDTIDLQSAIASVREADAAFQELPADLRRQFPKMTDLVKAVDNGSLVIKDKEPETPVNPPAPTA